MPTHVPRRVVVLSTVLLAGVVASSRVLAQGMAGSSRPISLVVSGGATVPTGAFKDYNDLGVHADVSVIVRLMGLGIRLRPEISYGRFSLKNDYQPPALQVSPGVATFARSTSAVGATSRYGGTADASTLLGLLGNVELPLAAGLYVLVGVGGTNIKSGASVTAEDVSLTALSYNGGAGFRFHLGGVSGFVEGRVSSLSLDKGKALFKEVRTIPVTFGIVF